LATGGPAALALVAALALGPGGGGIAAPQGAGAAECTWKRHTKRVVKRVRRHGKLRRVVRHERWWTCAPVAAPALDAPPSPPATESPPEEPQSNRLGVKAAEFLYILSRPSVRAGEVTVELNNYGEDAHNLNLQRQGSGGGEGPVLELPETAAHDRSVDSFDLPAGTYRLWCSLPEHDEKGMHATLQVEAG
jgi:plastocyanin